MIKDLTDKQFIKAFYNMDLKNESIVNVMFRELLENRDFTFSKNQDVSFCSLCSVAMPRILNQKARTKTAIDIVLGKSNTFKSFDEIEVNQPYLLNEQGKDTVGFVRVDSVKAIDKEFEYTVKDYVSFIKEDIKCDFKFNDEKMQMFSIAYPLFKSDSSGDTDGEYITDDDLSNMVKQVAEDGIEINLEHDQGQYVKSSDARIIEFYQARTDWQDGNLSIRKGDVVSTTQFYDTSMGRSLWSDLKANKYTTYSIEGNSNKPWERE